MPGDVWPETDVGKHSLAAVLTHVGCSVPADGQEMTYTHFMTTIAYSSYEQVCHRQNGALRTTLPVGVRVHVSPRLLWKAGA